MTVPCAYCHISGLAPSDSAAIVRDAVDPVRRLFVRTHRDPKVAGGGVVALVDAAAEAGLKLVTTADEGERHPVLAPFVEGAEPDAVACARSADAAIVLAGDGTMLHLASELLDGPPVLGVNYGMLGYLSGVSHDRIEEAVGCLASGEFHTVKLHPLEAHLPDGSIHRALNDVVASGGVTGRVVEVGWRVVNLARNGEVRVDTMASVPCDGVVVATPVGSTAYNLSNGGPVMAWGVRGYVVSFIAPHTLAARPLVVAPDHAVEIEHLGRGVPLQVLADGRVSGQLEPGQALRVGKGSGAARLAMIEDKSFYARYRDNFAGQLTYPGPRHRRSEVGAVEGEAP